MTAGAGKPLVIGVVGPTASGKTGISLALADRLPVEIVCMDSMQIYRGMDIGTAKPTRAEQAAVPHHMLDIADPKDSYSVAEYARAAAACIEDIVTRDRVPVLTGGTGLYLKALRYPMTLGNTPAEPAIRAEYQAFLSEKGTKALHDLLAARDPASAARLHPNDTRRVIRALEVYDITGLPFSAQALPAKQEERYNLRLFAPSWPREALYNRIDSRVDGMVRDGLFDEVQGLLHAGVPDSAQSMQGLGYQEAIPYLMGRADREGTISLIKRRTRNYAKRQLTWFRKEQGLTLLDAGGSDAAQLAGQIIQTMEDGHA